MIDAMTPQMLSMNHLARAAKGEANSPPLSLHSEQSNSIASPHSPTRAPPAPRLTKHTRTLQSRPYHCGLTLKRDVIEYFLSILLSGQGMPCHTGSENSTRAEPAPIVQGNRDPSLTTSARRPAREEDRDTTLHGFMEEVREENEEV